MFSEFHTGLLTYLKFTFGLPKKLTEGTDLSIALSLKYKCQERDSLDKWKNAQKILSFLFEGLCPTYSISPPAYTCVFINQEHMHFVGTKKKVIQSTSATEGAQPLLNRNKKELITTACEQLSST
uniref:Putative ovule protein n=1 Tax=Solanum chacoense TaxID=4108 RepID=A0A0V0HDH2_SOLCH